MLFAFSAALIAPLGLALLYEISRRVDIPRSLVLAAVVAGIFFTSFIPKYGVNTSLWMCAGFNPAEGLNGQGYAWIAGLPKGTPVFDMGGFATRVIGLDMYSCEWCEDIQELRESQVNMTPSEFHSEVKRNGYQYIMVDVMFYQEHGMETAQTYLTELIDSGLFVPVHNTQTAIVMSVT
jgi:hypothetical protein